ncbi:hypothetical protein TRAPUB_2784, partial [Trametes pubescens]
ENPRHQQARLARCPPTYTAGLPRVPRSLQQLLKRAAAWREFQESPGRPRGRL